MELAQRIEHTNLRPDSTKREIEVLCEQAVEHGFRSVVVPSSMLKVARSVVGDTPVNLITVVDYPFGYSHTASKVESIKKAKDQGANGVDVVLNYNAVLNGDWAVVETDISTVVHASHMQDLEVKLIVELGQYPSRFLKQVVELCMSYKPDYIKTNTGFEKNKVTMDQMQLLIRFLDGAIPVKASGGIRNISFVRELLHLGTDLIGTSASLQIIQTDHEA